MKVLIIKTYTPQVSGVEIKLGNVNLVLSVSGVLYIKSNDQVIKANDQALELIKKDLNDNYSNLQFVDPLAWNILINFFAFH